MTGLKEYMVEAAALGWFEQLGCHGPKSCPQMLLNAAPLRSLLERTGAARD